MYLGSNVLTINIARFQRRMPIHMPVNPSFVRNTSHNPPPPASAWLLRGSKTFANIVAGSVHTAKPTHMRINLKPSSDIDNTLFSSFLLGEANNLDTLKAIPSLLKDAGIICGKVFYYGGLCTLIGFDDEADASNFLANSETWKQWFSWVKKGDSTINWKFERIIEVKIVGLPPQFRTTENFQKILAHRGKILDKGDDNIWKFVDLSHVNVCLLSESKTKINEEIIIEHGNGKYFTIGIVEDVCFLNPFVENATSVNGDHMETDQEDRDDASSKGGISNTYSVKSEKKTIPDVEEGEFIPEDGNGAGYPAKDSVVSDVNKGDSKVSGVNQVGNKVVDSKVSGVNQVGKTSNASNDEIDDFNAGIVEEILSNEVGDAFKDKVNLDMKSNDSKIISTEKHLLFNGVDDTKVGSTPNIPMPKDISITHNSADNVTFPVDEMSGVAVNTSNIPAADGTIIEESVGGVVNSHTTVNSAPPILVPWDPSTLDGSWFNFGTCLASTRKKRRRFSPTKQAHFDGSSDPSGVPSNAPVPSIDLNRNINSGDGASNGC